MKKILSAISLSGVLYYLLPAVAFAQTSNPGNFTTLTTFGSRIITFVNGTVVPLIFALAFLVFIWGVFKYFILGGADEGKREEGKNLLLYSIIGFLLMVSLWGIVNLVSNGFGFANERVDTLLPIAPSPSRDSVR